MDDNYAFGLCYHMYILIYVLMAQTMREWIEQKSLPLRYVGICSDTRAGRNSANNPALANSIRYSVLMIPPVW